MTNQTELTSNEAAEAYAASWNTLDFSRLGPMLAENVSYISQNVIVEIEGKAGLMTYFSDIADMTGSSPEKKVFAELGVTMPYDMYPKGGEPCVILSQGNKDHVIALVLFKIKHNKISEIEYCTYIPKPSSAHRSGKYPV